MGKGVCTWVGVVLQEENGMGYMGEAAVVLEEEKWAFEPGANVS